MQFGPLTIIAGRPGMDRSVPGKELGIGRVNAGDEVLRLVGNAPARREVSPRDCRFKEVPLTAKDRRCWPRACSASVGAGNACWRRCFCRNRLRNDSVGSAE